MRRAKDVAKVRWRPLSNIAASLTGLSRFDDATRKQRSTAGTNADTHPEGQCTWNTFRLLRAEVDIIPPRLTKVLCRLETTQLSR